MLEYNAKQMLYAYIDTLRTKLGIANESYPLDIAALCESLGTIQIMQHPFETRGFCGAALVGEKIDTIMLNANRDPIAQNFDCGHELIHLTRHRNDKVECFNCFDPQSRFQNSFREWEANEGSAELLVPYRQLLPLVKKAYSTFTHWAAIQGFAWDTAKRYNVTTTVIETRLRSLKYEINQYLNGTPIDKIDILSDSKQKLYGIHVESINELGARLFRQEPKKPKRQSIHSLIEVIKDD